MALTHFAKALGRRGGLKRAERLSAQRKREIASAGGRARSESILAAKRIEENFRYLEAVQQIQRPPKTRSLKNTRSKLPGIYG